MKQFLAVLILMATLKPLFNYLGGEEWAKNWKTDWISGVGIAVLVVVGPMIAAIVYMRYLH